MTGTSWDSARDSIAQGYIEIAYPPDAADPARIFRAMAKLLDAFSAIDSDLVRSVSTSVEPVLLLERVEAGSLRSWIRTALVAIPDDSLQNLDWKPILGQYLVRAKHRLLTWASDVGQVESRGQILELQAELISLAPPSLPALLLVQPVPPERLLDDLRLLSEATEELTDDEVASYVSDNSDTPIVGTLGLTSERVEELLTHEIIRTESRLPLLVKKPDYLGNSMWEFRTDDRSIEARILDPDWLRDFQAGKHSLTPGDALDAQLRSELFRGLEGNVVTTRHFVDKVYGVIHQPILKQIDLL